MPSRFSLRRNPGDDPTAEVPAPEPLVPAEVGTRGYEPGSHDTTTFEPNGYDLRGDYNGQAEDYDGDAGEVYPEGYGEGGLVAAGPGSLSVPEMDDDEAWLTPDTRRRIKIAIPTFLLGALAVIAGAFWGGAVVQKHFGTSSTAAATTRAGAFAGRGGEGFAGFGGATGAEGATGAAGATGAGGFAGEGASGATGFGGAGGFTRETPTAEGTISAISGDDLTVKPTSGADIKVVLSSSTVVTRSGKGSAGTLKVGDTVRVEGAKASDGTVTATSVTATAAGVSATTGAGGFGGAAGGTGFSGAAGTGFSGATGTGSSTGGTSSSTVANGGFSGDGSGASGG